jgi:hypothetical protein
MEPFDFSVMVPTISDTTMFSAEVQPSAEVCCLTAFFDRNGHNQIRKTDSYRQVFRSAMKNSGRTFINKNKDARVGVSA